MYTVELHTHSAHSYDGRDPVEDLLERAAAADLDAIAVTDHDTVAGGREVADLAPEYGLLGIPGVEVSSEAGHVLALGVDRDLSAGLPFAETVQRIRDAGGIAVVPHPFQKARSGVLANISRAELADHADAIEVYNSRLLTGRSNRKAARFARREGIPMTAGSDAHIGEMVGRATTTVAATDRSVEAILSAIEAGETTVEGTRTPWRISFRQAAGGVKRRVAARVGSLLE